MTFNIYIRLFMEAFLFMILSSIRELYLGSQLNSSQKIASFAMNFIIIIIWGGFIGIAIWQWRKSKNKEQFANQYYFNELFLGIKNNFRSRIYSILFLSKRILLVTVVILFEILPMIVKVIIFVMIECVSCITILKLRPFRRIKDNLIEIINEIFFLFLSSFMVIMNKKDRWNSWQNILYLNLLMINITIVSLISLSN